MSDSVPSWNYNPLLKQDSFDYTVDSPGTWLFSALDLKVAADRINWVSKPVRDDEPSIGLFKVYRMLIGMSMESLLKGILVAQGEQILNKQGKLRKEFATHDLHALAVRINTDALQFSDHDIKILANLKPFTEWAGRYPLPISADGLIVPGHSNIEVQLELELWRKLYDQLVKIGWITKAGGRRLYFDKGRNVSNEQENGT
ncbi:MAG: hypothetical protein NTW71_09845 [Deltaproteobacteria bacterium]|nr:hypothetical protein [Deltaproteobacteria bacterium]